ncbi:hypothetical protein KAU11_03740 [Candidatus Babeliales bacterium]|nr:hypothetical protein [Candidatus Babeliales bacterium]
MNIILKIIFLSSAFCAVGQAFCPVYSHGRISERVYEQFKKRVQIALKDSNEVSTRALTEEYEGYLKCCGVSDEKNRKELTADLIDDCRSAIFWKKAALWSLVSGAGVVAVGCTIHFARKMNWFGGKDDSGLVPDPEIKPYPKTRVEPEKSICCGDQIGPVTRPKGKRTFNSNLQLQVAPCTVEIPKYKQLQARSLLQNVDNGQISKCAFFSLYHIAKAKQKLDGSDDGVARWDEWQKIMDTFPVDSEALKKKQAIDAYVTANPTTGAAVHLNPEISDLVTFIQEVPFFRENLWDGEKGRVSDGIFLLNNPELLLRMAKDDSKKAEFKGAVESETSIKLSYSKKHLVQPLPELFDGYQSGKHDLLGVSFYNGHFFGVHLPTEAKENKTADLISYNSSSRNADTSRDDLAKTGFTCSGPSLDALFLLAREVVFPQD